MSNRRSLTYKPCFKSNPRAANGDGTWSVPSLCKAYGWPTGLEGGGVIAIVELDGGWVQSDMDAYFQQIGQPLPSIADISINGVANTPNRHLQDPRDPDLEVTMDIQIAAAAYYVATGQRAVIRVYWADDIAPAVLKAAADGCDVCSISWGMDEAEWGKGAAQAMEAAALKAATQNKMAVFAASGDNDSSDGGPTPANVDAPASCPHVIGCGGTRKTPASETVWNNNPGSADGGGTGGGFSTFFPKPAWQLGIPQGSGRMIPDVAANADPETGYQVIVHGNPMAVGGTSAVAPLYAGLFGAFGKKLGFITPKLFQNRHCFNDVVEGDNGMFRARPGPDACTGLGSPIGAKLAALFNAKEAARQH